MVEKTSGIIFFLYFRVAERDIGSGLAVVLHKYLTSIHTSA
jgi:hypothetical protein